MKKLNNLEFLMYFLLILASIFIISTTNALAINTCFNTSQNITVCHNTDSGIYPQNIDLWEGHNERYGVFVENPDDELNQDVFTKTVRNIFDNGKIDVTKLGDDTTFTFQSVDDFYNLIQQQNAGGNITLFTQAELNQETRERTLLLTAEVLQWTVVLFIIVMELFKMSLSLITIIASMYVFFRLIPFALKKINLLIFKIAVGSRKK